MYIPLNVHTFELEPELLGLLGVEFQLEFSCSHFQVKAKIIQVNKHSIPQKFQEIHFANDFTRECRKYLLYLRHNKCIDPLPLFFQHQPEDTLFRSQLELLLNISSQFLFPDCSCLLWHHCVSYWATGVYFHLCPACQSHLKVSFSPSFDNHPQFQFNAICSTPQDASTPPPLSAAR